MPTSPRMRWPYPPRNLEDHFERFVDLVNAIDASVFTTREDKNLILSGGGSVSFNASTGVLAWSAALQMTSAVSGLRWYTPSVSAGGSVALQDGEMFYVSLTRAPVSPQSVAAVKGSRIPVSDDAVVLAQRLGSAVIFRNGAVIGDGQSAPLFGPRVLTTVADVVGIAGEQTTDQTTFQSKGGFRLDPTLYFPGGAGLTREIKLVAMLRTTTALYPAEVQLYNLTTPGAVAGSTVLTPSITPAVVESGALTLPGTLADYVVQLRLNDGAGVPDPSDYASCFSAILRITWSS